jgi:transposase
MGKKRRQYSPEFKLEAVRLFESGDLPASQIARDLGIDPGRLRVWCRDFKEKGQEAFPGSGAQTGVDAELKRLQKEVVQLKKERDFLKKAATFFAKESE